MRLFLFDIDGTLVSVRGAGRTAFALALQEIYGTAGTIERYDFRGRTDLRVVHDLMTEAGLDPGQIRARVDDFFQVYARELDRIVGDGSRVRVLPGVADVVRRLGARSDAVVGLLTGNVEAGARIKLEPTGLW
ncbi:MAG: HAD family hydrolase, partial [Candidatus Rokuibacteriota bacterium]